MSEFEDKLADPIKTCSSATETYKALQEHMVRVCFNISAYLSTWKLDNSCLKRKHSEHFYEGQKFFNVYVI